MGSRDHSETCARCGLQRGGLNDYECDCDQHYSITDPILMVALTFGVGYDAHKVRISWSEGSCMVDAEALVLGRWVPADAPGWAAQTPSFAVVCRATALAVGARIKEDVLRSLKGLP